MAASVYDGSYTFWYLAMGSLAQAKSGGVNGGAYTYWTLGLGLLRNLGASTPQIVPAIASCTMEMPVPARTVAAYW